MREASTGTATGSTGGGTGGGTEERVRALLADGVRSGRLRGGSRLPTERALVDQLGVGRTAIRSALAALEQEGSVVRHVGRGTFLAENAVLDATDATSPPTGTGGTAGDGQGGGAGALPQTSPAEIMGTRLLLEPEIAALAATQATQADLDRLRHCLTRARAATGYADFEGWDCALHRGIALAAHNTLLLALFDTMNAARDLPVWGSVKRRTSTPERRRGYQAGHHAIVDALTDRDPDQARDHMRAHLLDVRATLLGQS